MSVEQRIAELIKHEVAQAGALPIGDLGPDTVLARTGLDSLGFATLIVAMAQEFRLDPFGGSDEIVYPETFGELLDLYRKQPETGR